MSIHVDATRQSQADAYKARGSYYGIATGTPGSTSTPANEVSGVGPEGTYTRVQASTASGTTGSVLYGNVSIHAPATGSPWTATHAIICSSASGNTMFDWAQLVTPQPVGPLGGVITLTQASFVQT